MSEHRANISWVRKSNDFIYETYDRTHEVHFNGGQKIDSSAAPDFNGNAKLTNPEEMLAAAASSCHMLTFLAICARKKMTIDRYDDQAVAILEKNPSGKMAVTKIILSPKIVFSEQGPDLETIKSIHEKAHQNCFIANSLACEVIINEQ